MSKRKVGLLVMAYGTPYEEKDIEDYYTHIRRGRVPSPEMLADLTDRYKAIGGVSPLARITIEQGEALARELNERDDSKEYILYIGLKHITPFIEEAVDQMKADGISEAVSIVLAPHYSTFSVKSYNGRAKEHAAKIGGPVISAVESWYEEPAFISYWVQAINDVYATMNGEERERAVLIVSAHSLPEKILQNGDPYPEQLRATAVAIKDQADIGDYAIGWQSEGNTPDPWLGPDVQDLTRSLYASEGYQAFVYAPVGFVADHLEVLYDNDYECKVVTDELGVSYYRPPMPNVDQLFIEALANACEKKMS
ncbi:ferrochelatase [Aureibacillus halotolerans]|uniref:Coproporphyrin III ferrochelatase n=1 Tax=Aureibacillus halotolerans TaxID=1508390 RepID=A0A4R6UFU4_9BACI|nr:ferrochelatase [Aureibacillus halotolerans]TDQ42014.1 ferrochelatase [Aureibacillus halotolerans]